MTILDFGFREAQPRLQQPPMGEKTFKERTKKFGLAIVKLVELLPRPRAADVLGRQLLRAGTSVGANYRAACR